MSYSFILKNTQNFYLIFYLTFYYIKKDDLWKEEKIDDIKNERNSINKNSLLKVINGKSLRIKSELVFLYEKQNLI